MIIIMVTGRYWITQDTRSFLLCFIINTARLYPVPVSRTCMIYEILYIYTPGTWYVVHREPMMMFEAISGVFVFIYLKTKDILSFTKFD